MPILHLTLKRRWFDMIVLGRKLEEYREIKPHWQRIFQDGRPEWGAEAGREYFVLKLGEVVDKPSSDVCCQGDTLCHPGQPGSSMTRKELLCTSNPSSIAPYQVGGFANSDCRFFSEILK